jgi:protein-tyrosine phosphatase
MNYSFKPAARDESIVFGAERPGYPTSVVDEGVVQDWILFMKDQDIKRVCCFLSQNQLDYYDEDLLAFYRQEFGKENVCWAPVEDYHLADAHMLKERILPFLAESDTNKERVVVHCSGGIGRTGHILAAWLVYGRHFEIEAALSEVTAMGRNPFEAVESGTATQSQLYALLSECRVDSHE